MLRRVVAVAPARCVNARFLRDADLRYDTATCTGTA